MAMGRDPDGCFITADSVMDTMEDGTKTIREVAERAWVESMWRKKSRVAETPAGLRGLSHREPLTSAHKAWFNAAPKDKIIVNRRVAWASAKCGREAGLEHSTCQCGHPSP